jgi:hypothetical protein
MVHMKKFMLAVTVILSLSGCAVVDAYRMAPYDPNEYELITGIRAEAKHYKEQCNDPVISKMNASKLSLDIMMFALYSEHIPRNDALIKSSKSLQEIAQGLDSQYANAAKVSPAFCKIKFESIETSADRMQTIIGARPR